MHMLRVLALQLRKLLLFASCLAMLPSSTFCQQIQNSHRDIPPELQAADPEVNRLLEAARSYSDSGKYEAAFSKSREALQLAQDKGFVRDKALAEESVAVDYFLSGELEESLKLYQSSLQDAIDSSNPALEADVLVAIATSLQIQSNLTGELNLLAKALDRANQSKNLYVKVRVLGELGRAQIFSGKTDEGRKSIEEALRIDKANGYSFEALHSVYLGYAILSEPKPDLAAAIEQLEVSRDLAMKEGQFIALVLAENALAGIYVRKGEVLLGIAILESVRDGKIMKGGKTLAMPEAFISAVALPALRAVLLEGLAQAYETSQQPDKALQVWNELYTSARSTGNTAAEGEATVRMANIYKNKKDISNALNYYSISAEIFRKLGNNSQLTHALIGEALFLIQMGKGEQAVPLQNQIVEIARNTNNRQLQFLAYVVLAEIYQPAGNLQQARDVLEKAQAMVKPGPMDSEIDNKTVIEDYTRLAEVFKQLNDPIREVIELEKGFAVASFLKDDALANNLAITLKQKIEPLGIEKLIDDFYKAGKLEEALDYSIILSVYRGGPTTSGANQYWNLIWNIPFQLVNQPGGAEFLRSNMELVDCILAFEKIPILQALSEHYLYTDQKPEMALGFAAEVASFVDKAGEAVVAPIRARVVCTLAVANAQTNHLIDASTEARDCIDIANRTGDEDLKKRANAANVLVHLAANDIGAAQESLTYLLKDTPDEPQIHTVLALALAKNDRYQEAQSELNTALRIFKAKGAKASMAAAYIQMATSLDTGQSPEANREQLSCLESAMKILKELGDVRQQAFVAGSVGMYYLKMEKNKDALKSLGSALSLANESGESRLIALALSNLARAYSTTDDNVGAVVFYRKALDSYKNLNDPANEAFSLMGLYFALAAQHKSDEALSVLMQAKTAAANSSSAVAKFYVQLDFGWAYRRQGEFELSALAFRDAQKIAAEAGDLSRLAQSRVALAELLVLLGDWEGAADQTGEAIKLYQQLKDKQGESTADAELANIYGDRSSSIRDFEKSLSYFETAKHLGYKWSLDLDQLEIYLQTGQYPQAIASAKAGLEDCLIRKDTQCQAHALISLAEAERRSGDLSAAATTLSKAGPLVGKEKDFYLQGRLFYAQANQEKDSGHFRQSVELYEKVIVLVEQTKGSPGSESQRSTEETYHFIYDELIDALYSLRQESAGSERDEYAAEALKYAEANKAREFVYSWGKTFLYAAKLQLPSNVQDQEQRFLSKQQRLEAELQLSISGDEKGSGRNLVEIRQELAVANQDMQQLIDSLRRSYPAYAALKYPETVKLQEIPLRPGETLVETKMTDDSTFVWIIRRDQGEVNRLLAFYKVPQKREWFEKRVLSLRDAFNAAGPDAYDPGVSEELFQALFPGVYGMELFRSQTIIFIPDDVLFLIPFELLSPHATNGVFELLQVPTKYYPSISSIQIARDAIPASNWKKTFLGVGDPITSPEDARFDLLQALVSGEKAGPKNDTSSVETGRGERFPEKAKTRGYSFERIPGTATEIQEIAKLLSLRNQVVDVRLGLEATKESILETDLAQFRFINFATHGILPVDGGIKEPALVLSFDGRTPESMFLFASDILRLKLNADTVVLSACNTGSGKVSRAEGVMSLGRAFMAAGASSVTVSLWQVSDNSTQLFMEEYYKNLLDGKSKSEALALARAYLFSNGKAFKNPFFWAPFILLGE